MQAYESGLTRSGPISIAVPGFTSDAILGFIRDCVLWKQPANVIEIGSFMGRSTAVICNTLHELGGVRSMTCVDMFVQRYTPDYLDRPFMQYMINRCGPEIRELYTAFAKL
jgi:hypothetical protein